MTISMLLRTFFEIILFVAVIWCIFHEDRLAAFEKRILCNIKRRRLKVVVPLYNLIFNNKRAKRLLMSDKEVFQKNLN